MTAPALTEVEPPPFDVTGALPGPGVTVLEASAGTGKTRTLTSLVARYVADGVPLDSILAVTFTRMATGELRDRARGRLVTIHRRLASGPAGATPDEDEVAVLLGSGPPAEVSRRVQRLADALADFDAATIATTHGFCQLVLYGLGIAGDTATGITLLEDPHDLLEEVVADLFLRWSVRFPDEPLDPKAARAAAFEAVRNPDTPVIPTSGRSPSALIGRLADKARAEVGRRLMADGLLTYDNMLSRLAVTLRDPERGALACERLRSRYRVVLVDEFQDTDPVQWEVLRRAFTGPGPEGPTLVLIGDPKQAIYAFRGADVYAYLDAASKADQRYTLDRNWRADQQLLDATDALLYPLRLGHGKIPFRKVEAARSPVDPGLRSAPGTAPIRVRLVPDSHPEIRMTAKTGTLQKPSVAAWVARDVAADIASLLASEATLPDEDAPGCRRPVRVPDIAVLTRSNAQALQVREALRAAGVAAVVAGLDSVFASEAARDWLRLLEALQEPASRSRAAAAALTPFFGMDPRAVALAPEVDWESVHDRLGRWGVVLVAQGVAALWRAVTLEEGLPARVLGGSDGERRLTDLTHVAHLLHAEAGRSQLGAAALRAWLAARVVAAADEQSEMDERSRRLDSDAHAVQVLTIHRAKGLEFPIVYCPHLWDSLRSDRGSGPVVFHDPESGDERVIDVGIPSDPMEGPTFEAKAAYDAHALRAREERRGEDLRLLYVALTRARHQVVIWWARTYECRSSPLGRLIMCRDGDTGEVAAPRPGEPQAKLVRPKLEALAAKAPGLVSIEVAGIVAAAGGPAPDGPRPGPLAVARFDRELDLRWRRASYTSITAGLHERRGDSDAVGSEPEEAGVGDEPALPGMVAGASTHMDLVLPGPVAGSTAHLEPALDLPCALGPLPGGTEFGTFVHRVLERADFAAPDLRSAVAAAVADVGSPVGADLDQESLVGGLVAALTTPLGPILPGHSLAQVARADRLDELGFELPVAGGDRPVGAVHTLQIARLVGHWLAPERTAADAPDLSRYARALADPVLATTLRGYLNGSLDLVFRRRHSDGTERWYLADYKTNWLGDGERLTAWHYRPDALRAEMQRRHYPLQALLYLVALHRFLRWRLAGYDPGHHLGGVFYLFVRGMLGPDGPAVDARPCGVFAWSPPTELVVGLSELLDRGAA